MSSENVQSEPIIESNEETVNNETTSDDATPSIDQTNPIEQNTTEIEAPSEDTETQKPPIESEVIDGATETSDLVPNQIDENITKKDSSKQLVVEENVKEGGGDEQETVTEDFLEEETPGDTEERPGDTEEQREDTEEQPGDTEEQPGDNFDDEAIVESNVEGETSGGEEEETEDRGEMEETEGEIENAQEGTGGGSGTNLENYTPHVAFGEETAQEPEPIEIPRPQGRRKSMGMGAMPRFKSIDATNTLISGDFKGLGSDLDMNMDLKFDAIIDEPEYGECEEEGSAEEEPIVVDREAYYELNNIYEKLYNKAKLRNNFLQRKLTDYYKKRRMYHVLKESEFQSDTQQKYERKLDALEAVSDIDAKERARIHEELNELKTSRNEKSIELKKLFESMQHRESEIGKDLMTASTAKINLEKIVERLLKRQRSQMASVIKMRLQYIKIRDRVNEKTLALRALDNLGSHLHLIDYEQLKVDNRNHQDKLEERDNDLIRLRAKCQNAMQVLAHKREKSSAVEMEMLNLEERHESVDGDYDSAREQLNYLKQERDWFRHQANKVMEESGLLMKPKLLRDMEDAIKEVEMYTKKLHDITEEYNRVSEQLRVVRLHMEKNNDKKLVTPKKHLSLCKGRPSLMAIEDGGDDRSLI